jgi:hypothetical protein
MRRIFILAAPIVSMALHACGGGSGGNLPATAQSSQNAAAPAAASQVQWRAIRGVITAQGVDNPISANISSGTFAWTVAGGHADADLSTGALAFSVDGLVINGSQFSGTPGPITAVVGTLVCNPGTANEVARDTPPVALSSSGSASFSGQVANGPFDCGNPLFQIRIAVPQSAAGRWIATGTQRVGVNG